MQMMHSTFSCAFCCMEGGVRGGEGLKRVARRPVLLRLGVADGVVDVTARAVTGGAREARMDVGVVVGFVVRVVVFVRRIDGRV